MINLEDEVREGFFITTMMKRNWAVQLDLLMEIDAVCRRHDIQYFIADGTLLGAVRHRGFIPWDDDIDLYMMRSEYERFRRIANQELPPPFMLRHTGEKEFTDRQVNKVDGDNEIHIAEDYLASHYGFPYTYAVDIFILEGKLEDEQAEKTRRTRLLELESLIAAEKDTDRRYVLASERERLYTCCSDKDSRVVEFFWLEGVTFEFDREWFSETVLLPFEDLTLPAPKEYRKILNAVFTDYSIIVRNASGHRYPCYIYEEQQLRSIVGRNPFRYTFSEADLRLPRPPSRESRINEMSLTLQKAADMAKSLLANGSVKEAQALLAESGRITEVLEAELKRPKEVLFCPVKPDWWDTMLPLYKKYAAETDSVVSVIPVPWYERQADGSLSELHDPFDEFPDDLPLVRFDAYDFGAGRPDLIFFQFPFDDYNTALAIPPAYYARTLRQFSGKLVYIPPYRTDDPVPDDDALRANLRVLAEQPAVMIADEVLLPSARMRDFYIETLTALYEDGTRSFWEHRIMMTDSY